MGLLVLLQGIKKQGKEQNEGDKNKTQNGRTSKGYRELSIIIKSVIEWEVKSVRCVN